ncbi:portal protein [Pseudoalteromonas neustonica]|uniref:Portal protein n=1 Tax=Pseudoalteromonas neustonica TaxID=1840331 RepID=A0ABY3F864_9GAMM|nr:portal protein [Pseudoalteromonas neustonica]TVU79860.1 portal protein [Pseudoalteromonas neustonica]
MADFAKNKEGFTLDKLLTLLGDIDSQPDWRTPATKACAYYDGDQLSEAVRKVLRDRGQPEIVHNMVGPTIDGVLGLEARSRSDLMIVADDEQGEELAKALNEKFKDTWRLTNADRACSDAYASQLKAGIGWVEVTRNPMPFAAPYRVKFIHRREVWWDWNAQEADRSDARWMMRKKWMELDEALATFPDHKEILKQSVNQWEDFLNTVDEEHTEDHALHSAWHDSQSWNRATSEWLDQQRKRVLLQVIYYKVWKRAHIIRLSDGQVIEYDKNNQVHLAAVESGRVQLEYAAFPKVREAWFVGPHRIIDRPSEAPDGMYNLIPFIGYQKDASGEPYGLISRMVPAQDGINMRVIRLNYLLQARRIIADEDATQLGDQRLKEEVEKPDGYIPLNPERKNKTKASDAISIQNDVGIAAQQFNLMQNDMKLIQDTAGVYNSMLGQDSNATSGVAIANLVEQGTTTLAEINDNFHYSRNKVGELVLAYNIEDLKPQNNVQVTVNRDDKAKRKQIVLNEPNENGKRNNDVARWKGHIALAPVKATPTYRQQQATLLSNVMSQIPPEAQAAAMPMFVELMDLPNKEEFIATLRQALNIPKPQEDMSEEELAAAQAQAEKAQAMEQLQMEEIQGKLEELKLKREELKAKIIEIQKRTETEEVKDDKLIAETEKILAEVRRSNAEVAAMKSTVQANIQQQLDAIKV